MSILLRPRQRRVLLFAGGRRRVRAVVALLVVGALVVGVVAATWRDAEVADPDVAAADLAGEPSPSRPVATPEQLREVVERAGIPAPSFSVDPGVHPLVATVPGLAEGQGPRPTASVADEYGNQVDFVTDEAVVLTSDPAALDQFAGRWNGTVIRSYPLDELVWTIDGREVGTGTDVRPTGLEVGAHTIRVTATDAEGFTVPTR